MNCVPLSDKLLHFVGIILMCLLAYLLCRLAEVHHTISSDSGVPMESQRTVAYVELLKRRDEPLGLVLKGGCGRNGREWVWQEWEGVGMVGGERS